MKKPQDGNLEAFSGGVAFESDAFQYELHADYVKRFHLAVAMLALGCASDCPLRQVMQITVA